MRKLEDCPDQRLPLALYDVFGIDDERKAYPERLLELMLDGKIPVGFKINQDLTLVPNLNEVRPLDQRMHMVLFLVRFSSITNEAVVENTKYMLRACSDKGLLFDLVNNCTDYLRRLPTLIVHHMV